MPITTVLPSENPTYPTKHYNDPRVTNTLDKWKVLLYNELVNDKNK